MQYEKGAILQTTSQQYNNKYFIIPFFIWQKSNEVFSFGSVLKKIGV